MILTLYTYLHGSNKNNVVHPEKSFDEDDSETYLTDNGEPNDTNRVEARTQNSYPGAQEGIGIHPVSHFEIEQKFLSMIEDLQTNQTRLEAQIKILQDKRNSAHNKQAINNLRTHQLNET